jgi:hypothetical protein
VIVTPLHKKSRQLFCRRLRQKQQPRVFDYVARESAYRRGAFVTYIKEVIAEAMRPRPRPRYPHPRA